MGQGVRPSGPAGWIRRQRKRIETTLWDEGAGGFPHRLLRTGATALWKFQTDRGFLRASALTYATLLGIVPLVALVFSVLKGLGVPQPLEHLILSHIAAGNEEAVSRILEYAGRTDMRSLGVLGLGGLILAALSVLGNIEASFNDIWQVHRGRNLIRKFSDYVALVLVTPVLLLASFSLTTTLQAPAVQEALSVMGPAIRLLLRAMPLIATWAAFTAAYVILPNRKIPTTYALAGGLVAAILWQLSESAYVRFQFGVAQYNAIYGAMAQLPILLVWLYLCWCIVLLGAELACVLELPGTGSLQAASGYWTPRPSIALSLLLTVARHFESGLPGPTERELIAESSLSPAQATRVIRHLVEAGLLVLSQDEPLRFHPGLSPSRTSVADLLERVEGASPAGGVRTVAAEQRIRASRSRDLSKITWAQLALEEAE